VEDDLHNIVRLRDILLQDGLHRFWNQVNVTDQWNYNLEKGLPDLECQLRHIGGDDSDAYEFTPDELRAFCRKRNYVSNVSELRRSSLFSKDRTTLITLSYNQPLRDSSESVEVDLTKTVDLDLICFGSVTNSAEPLICSPTTVHMVDVLQWGGKISGLKFSSGFTPEAENASRDSSRYHLRGADFFFIGLSWKQKFHVGNLRRRTKHTKVRRVKASNQQSTLGFLCCRFSVNYRADCFLYYRVPSPRDFIVRE
jgi:hypothetical protein